jgi:adenosylcobinamide-GDP ribazoletransferase
LGFFTSLRFLTIIPWPWSREASPEEVGKSIVYFPLVGLLLGLILVGCDELFGLRLSTSLTSILLIVVMIILTGALHFDGFIDTCDGALVRSSPEERLKIMADSHVGSFGVVAACCLILVKYVALSDVPDDMRISALVIMPALSRWSMVYALFAFPYARPIGTGQAFKKQANWQRMAIAMLVAALIAAVMAGWSGLAVMGALWLVVFGVAAFLRRRLGGLTGDSYGAINELSEVLVLILLPLLAEVMSTHFIGPWELIDFAK